MIDRRVTILVCFLCLLTINNSVFGMSPDDERVSGYLAERKLDSLLEVQLFDRIMIERDAVRRSAIAAQLGALYLDGLGRESLNDDERRLILAKGRVLVGMMPADEMLDLRIELLIEMYKEYEQAADLDRIGLLDDETRELGIEVMGFVSREMGRIAGVSGIRVDQMVRNVSRATDERIEEYEQELRKARATRSRGHFFHGWSGYAYAALRGRSAGGEVLAAFGWVLGFEGKLPVLNRVDMDLLEYDHVARSMLGVALVKMHNGDLSEARVWLMAVEASGVAPVFAVDFARQRLLEVSLLERDWIAADRRADALNNSGVDSLLGVAQARLLVIRTLEALSRGDRGKGGSEGATEVARVGLDRLIELGEIEHVLDLHDRFGELPLLDSGFVSLYTRGLSGFGKESYSEAGESFGLALGAKDVGRYTDYAGDAVLKLAICELKLGRPGGAVEVLDVHADILESDSQKEESAWLKILAYDMAVRDGQSQMAEMLGRSIEEYLGVYPLSKRAGVLIVQYAMTPYLESDTAYEELVIDDTDNPLAIPARRKLIQMLYKNPELVDDGEAGRDRVYEVIVGHAQWVWENETGDASGLKELSERFAIVRIVIGTGIRLDDVDLGFLDGVIDRGERLIAQEPSLVGAKSELGYRRVQVLLLKGEIDRAGELVLVGGVLDDDVRNNALLMVFERAAERFGTRQSVPSAQAVVRYGRGALDTVEDEKLDRRFSFIAEAIAGAAEYLGVELEDETMLEYSLSLSLRVYQDETPSLAGLVRTARLSAKFEHMQVAMECWLLVVGRLEPTDPLWAEARFESLRLLMESDADRGRQVYQQFVLLYPDGLVAPWGDRLEMLFGGVGREGEP